MTLQTAAITFDCADALKLATFWSEALGRPIDRGEPAAGQFFARIADDGTTGAPAMMFIAVPEPKTAKNRVHLDLDSDDLVGDVQRLLSLGATHIHDKDEYGMHWSTLADPEGNEFCVGQH